MNSPPAVVYSHKTELRHLPAAARHQLARLLDVNENWKLLAETISNPDHPNEFLLKTTDILLLEDQLKRPGGSPSNALIEYWGTYGRKRHRLLDAIYFLEQCNLNRAADIIKGCINETSDGDIPVVQERKDLLPKRYQHSWSELPEYTSCVDNLNKIKPSAPNESLLLSTSSWDNNISLSKIDCDTNILLRFAYTDISNATANFASTPVFLGGTKLGEGSFGEVFCATTDLLNSDRIKHSKFVAIKRFKQVPASGDDQTKRDGQFLSELNLLIRFQHPNLVRLFGYSDDGPHFCIVTEYLENGSLHDYLNSQARKSEHPLPFQQRWKISVDVCSAIVYLHTYTEKDNCGIQIQRPFIHRDIKGANIFLDAKFNARLGDLGLVRQGSNSNTMTTVVTNTVIGTSVYMAPEAFRGDVSVKIDTFSYGVVLLELLTGLAAFDATRDESDIVSYIDEMLGDEFDNLANSTDNGHRKDLQSFIDNSCKMIDKDKFKLVLDQSCTDWNYETGEKLILLAKCCIEQRKRNRPTMVEVFEVLPNLQDNTT